MATHLATFIFSLAVIVLLSVLPGAPSYPLSCCGVKNKDQVSQLAGDGARRSVMSSGSAHRLMKIDEVKGEIVYEWDGLAIYQHSLMTPVSIGPSYSLLASAPRPSRTFSFHDPFTQFMLILGIFLFLLPSLRILSDSIIQSMLLHTFHLV